MSGSLTVIGGQNSTHGLTGLVTIPSGFTGALVTSLQSMLTADSNAVTSGGANFENLNAAGLSGAQSATVGAFAGGILDITNTSSVGATTAGAAAINLSVPNGYNTLVVQAPGAETITGNGAANQLDIFGANSSVIFNTNGGNGPSMRAAAIIPFYSAPAGASMARRATMHPSRSWRIIPRSRSRYRGPVPVRTATSSARTQRMSR